MHAAMTYSMSKLNPVSCLVSCRCLHWTVWVIILMFAFILSLPKSAQAVMFFLNPSDCLSFQKCLCAPRSQQLTWG